MPLLAIWQSNPTAVLEMSIGQVVGTAGDGALTDGSKCSEEFRAYLSQVTSSKLANYVEQCLSVSIEKGGMILQDLMNELGRRLDFEVTNGRYQGTSRTVGYDGLWLGPDGHSLVVEIKTTDSYRVSLDRIVEYRRKLIDATTIVGHPSILIVVGRQDTGELEAQVRGSRHAWDIRLISVEALISLIRLKEDSDDVETARKIRSILVPMEYTRLDGLVDVMFTTAKNIESAVAEDEAKADPPPPVLEPTQATARASGTWEFTDAALLQKKRDAIILAVAEKIGTPLVKKTRAMYWSPDRSKRVTCTVSKRYERQGSYRYWYAYHPQWDDFLAEGEESYLVLGCMDLPYAFALPRAQIRSVLEILNITETEKGMYWHLHIAETEQGDYELVLPTQDSYLPLKPFIVKITPAHERQLSEPLDEFKA